MRLLARRLWPVWCLAITAPIGCASDKERLEALEARLATLERLNAFEARMAKLEEQARLDSAVNTKWHEGNKERFAAIEKREERTRLEVARLGWNKPVASNGTDALTPEAWKERAKSGDALYKRSQAGGWDPFERAVGQKLVTLYSSGKPAEGSGFLDATDPDGKPYRPRPAGEKGVDGEGLLGKPLQRSRFLSSTGDTVDLKDYVGKKNVVLTVLRGFDGAVCIACTGQTLAIAQNLDEFTKREAEVFLVYPGKPETVPVFLDAVRDLQGGGGSLPVEILLDVDLSVVKEFKIEGKLAKPSTLVLDRTGTVRFAHVGQSKTDRPSVPDMLAVLDKLKGK